MKIKVDCKICGREFKAVTNTHLKYAHGISTAEYKSMFPGVCMESEATKNFNYKHRCDISKLPQSLVARSKTGKANKGKKRTEEFKKKRSEQYSGKGNPFYGKKHSEETCKKLSAHFQGVGIDEWEGFSNKAIVRLDKSSKMKYWRHAVYERDDYTCILCDKRGGDLNAHHIVKRANREDLIYNVDNGVTLCVRCHKKTYGREEAFETTFMLKNGVISWQ